MSGLLLMDFEKGNRITKLHRLLLPTPSSLESSLESVGAIRAFDNSLTSNERNSYPLYFRHFFRKLIQYRQRYLALYPEQSDETF